MNWRLRLFFERKDAEGDGRLREFTEVHTVSNQSIARSLTSHRDRIMIVERERPRTVVFQCPCGCGEVIVIPVDPATSHPWQLRRGASGVREVITLLPSVWRSTGCESHFVLWRNQVLWLLDDDEPEELWPADLVSELRAEWDRIRARTAPPRKRR